MESAETLQRLLDRDSISQVLARYSRGIDRGDLELLTDVFWPDSYENHGTFEGLSRLFAAEVLPMLERLFERTMHFLGNSLVDIHGHEASGETYFMAHHRLRAGGDTAAVFGEDYVRQHPTGQRHDLLTCGRYIDRFEKRQGEWRIIHRRVVVDWCQANPSCDTLGRGLLVGNIGTGRRNRSDPVYGQSDRNTELRSTQNGKS